MPKRDPRVDAYIANSAEFARPVLEHFRSIVEDACPDAQETVKWGRPSWQYAGALMCSMAAFKQHCTFNFWKAPLLTFGGKAVGFGKDAQFAHITAVAELPNRSALVRLVRQAAKLNADGVKESVMSSGVRRQARKPLPIPADLKRALTTHPKARATFEGFPPSHRREYIEWITEAKREETRAQRLRQTVQWLDEGKPRNWKYMSR